jgi:hypothetical protein
VEITSAALSLSGTEAAGLRVSAPKPQRFNLGNALR